MMNAKGFVSVKIYLPLIAAIAVELIATLPVLASANVVTVRSLQSWEGPGARTATTLSVVEYSCAQKSRRVFVELGKPGARWVLETHASPPTGELRYRIRHEQEAWELVLLDRYDETVEIRSPSVHGDGLFWQKLASSGPVERERTVYVGGTEVLKMSGSGRFMAPEIDPESFSSQSLQNLRRDGGLPAAVAKDLPTLLRFMETSEVRSGVLGRFLPLVRFARSSLASEDNEKETGEPAPTWRRVDTQAFGGDQKMTREELDLLRGFAGLDDPEDPLAGLHAPPGGGCPE